MGRVCRAKTSLANSARETGPKFLEGKIWLIPRETVDGFFGMKISGFAVQKSRFYLPRTSWAYPPRFL